MKEREREISIVREIEMQDTTVVSHPPGEARRFIRALAVQVLRNLIYSGGCFATGSASTRRTSSKELDL